MFFPHSDVFLFQGQEAVRGYGSTTNGSKEPPPESLPLSPRIRLGSVRESSEYSDSSGPSIIEMKRVRYYT